MLTLMVNRSPETSVAVQSKRLLSLTLSSGQSTVMVVSFIRPYHLAIEASTYPTSGGSGVEAEHAESASTASGTRAHEGRRATTTGPCMTTPDGNCFPSS